MTPVAITFMIASMTVLWGGLAYNVWRLRRHPDLEPDPAEEQDAA